MLKGVPRIVIWIAIIAVVGIGGFIFRDRLSSGAGDLAVGDCFDDPTGVTEVEEVQHHPCNEAHTSEVVFVGNMSGADDAYPNLTQFDDYVGGTCLPAWETYTGRDYESDTELDLGYYYPLEEGWGDGDREVICYVVRVDGATMTQSVKAAP